MGQQFDFFYGEETRQYKYFVIPQILVLDKRFEGLSDRAKILYCIMLDRSSLSIQHEWMDEEGRVYIIMSREEVMNSLSCSHVTAQKYVQELVDFGLIKKRRRGQGNPDWIYVCNFNKLIEKDNEIPTVEKEDKRYGVSILSEVKKPLPQEVKKPLPQEVKKCLPQEVKKPLSQEVKKSLPQEVKKPLPKSDLYNNTNINRLTSSSSEDIVDREEEEDDEQIKERVGYYAVLKAYPEVIAESVFRELKNRDAKVIYAVNQTAFTNLCKSIADYHGKIGNLEKYISKCVDNMIFAMPINQRNIKNKHGTMGQGQITGFEKEDGEVDWNAFEKNMVSNLITSERSS